MLSNLFKGELVRLAAVEAEPMVEAYDRWCRDSEYYRLLDSEPCHQASQRKSREQLEKDLQEERADEYIFMIRTLDGDRVIGEIGLDGINYAQGEAYVGIGLGERAYWGRGFGTDAMRILLRFAFDELNLRRVTLDVFEYNTRAVRSYEKVGFTLEGRMRGMLKREGERWDLVFMGILREEWERLNRMEDR